MAEITQDMLRELSQFKKVCPLFGTRTGCKAGKRCKFLHTKEKPTRADETAYYMDVRTDEAGNVKMVPRVPLTEALAALFKETGTIVLGRQAGRQAGSMRI